VHLVQGVARLAWSATAMAQVARVGQMGVQASSTVYVHDLQASADAETRQALVQNPIQQEVFHPVPFNIDSATPDRIRCLTVSCGMNIFTSRQNHRSGPLEFPLKVR
jgi:hypothetical protein